MTSTSPSTSAISPNEARHIVDYAFDEDRLDELRSLNERKKMELLRRWEEEGKLAEEEAVDETLLLGKQQRRGKVGHSDDGGYENKKEDENNDDERLRSILEKDGVVREIVERRKNREYSTGW